MKPMAAGKESGIAGQTGKRTFFAPCHMAFHSQTSGKTSPQNNRDTHHPRVTPSTHTHIFLSITSVTR